MRLDFTLVGRDHLSRVLDRAGDASNRLGRRLLVMSINSDMAVRRFTNNATRNLSQMQRDTEAGGKALGELKKATMLLAPAAIPAAASLVPIAAGAATVGAAMAAMGAALVPQIKAMGEATQAETKWQDAVDKSGATSEEAVQAHEAYVQAVAKLPPETRKAAAAVSVLKDEFKGWSNSLSGDTMAPFIKGVSIVDALLPKTSGLVKAASTEADRFMTIVGGEIASPGLDSLNTKFTNFAQRTLRHVNDEIVHLLRVSEGKNVGGPAKEFMDWARAQGPTVASVLKSVATALVNVLKAGSDVGVGLLQVVEVLARLVSAVPPRTIATFLQLALALKLTKAAAFGLAAARSALIGFATQLLAMQAAAAGAPGRLAAVRLAIGSLSRSAKVAMAGTGIGLLIVALTELSQRGKQAPPDVDKLTSSLKQLGAAGKVTGEASKAFGHDLDGLYDKVRSLTDPSTMDKVQQFLVGWTGWDSTPVKDAKENLDSVDKALANLVQGGQSDLAAAALKRLTAKYAEGGRDTKKFTGSLDDYKSALSDAKFEQELAAESAGLFGAQAQSVQVKLDAQKRSADGLRQSIQALNDAQRQGLGGMIGFEASIDAAAKAAKDNAGSLKMVNGELDLNGPKAQAAASALNDLAGKTDEAAAQARQSGASWEKVNGIYARGRSELIASARAMGLNKTEAAQLADQILKIPDKKARVRMETEDATRDLTAFNAKLKASPGAKSVTLKTISSAAEQVLKLFGYKVTHLPDGSVKITATGGQALGVIGSVKAAIAALHDRHITLTTEHRTLYTGKGGRGANAYASGGTPKAGELAMVGEEGPELVVFGQAARVFDARTTRSIMSGTVGAGQAATRGLAAGLGSTGGVYAAARTMAGAVTAGIREELQIASPSKKTKALAKDVARGFLEGLTSSRDKIKSVSRDLANDIKTAFSGHKESALLKMVSKDTKKLEDFAKQRDKIAARIKEAKGYASDVTKNARSQAGLSALGMSPEEVTAGGIRSGLAQKLAQIKTFSRFISVLAKRGLNKNLLRQILDMGPVDGYAYASALAGADKATFSAINKSQKAIDSETTKLGRKGADILYDSGKQAGKGFLKGLEAQQRHIEDLMMRIAKSMQKAIKKALGIRSPSTVMAQLGVYSTQGLARGLVSGLPHLDRALGVVSGRVAATQPVLGRAAVAGRGGGGSMNVTITVQDARDPLAVAKEIRRELLELKRVFGLNVELKVG